MKKAILVLVSVCSLGLTACGGGGSEGSAEGSKSLAESQKLNGEYWAGVEDSSNHDLYLEVIEIAAPEVRVLSLYFPFGNLTHGIYRKSIGTFSKNGDSVKLKYSYETCNAVGSETLKVNSSNSNDSLSVKNGNTSVIYKNSEKWTPVIDLNDVVTMTEDVDCNLMPD